MTTFESNAVSMSSKVKVTPNKSMSVCYEGQSVPSLVSTNCT